MFHSVFLTFVLSSYPCPSTSLSFRLLCFSHFCTVCAPSCFLLSVCPAALANSSFVTGKVSESHSAIFSFCPLWLGLHLVSCNSSMIHNAFFCVSVILSLESQPRFLDWEHPSLSLKLTFCIHIICYILYNRHAGSMMAHLLAQVFLHQKHVFKG